jgi:hypothetical protein
MKATVQTQNTRTDKSPIKGYSNMASFFRFVDKRAIYRWYNLIRTCAFIPSQKRGIKFTNIRQTMLKLKTHSGFHDLFWFWYV